MKILVTGNAGFIGFHVARQLLQRGNTVIGIDNVNDYYDTHLKEARLTELEKVALDTGSTYEFIRGDIAEQAIVDEAFASHKFNRVIHLAAQPGVRYSLNNPRAYTRSNIEGFLNILEGCRYANTPHLIYASSSSVYGANTRLPYSESDGVNHPLSLYAATKRANELMAHSYSHLYNLPITGLRFFTVYGPWGRPDMAFFLFTKSILENQPIKVFNEGNHTRDFTYIDDIVEGVILASEDIAQPDLNWQGVSPDPSTSNAPIRTFNIGNNMPVKLNDYIEAIETAIGKKAIREMMPMQAGDVANTHADVSSLERQVGYIPTTSVKVGVEQFVAWYREYYRI